MKKRIFSILIALLCFLQIGVFAVNRVSLSPRMFSDENYVFKIKGSDKRFLLLDIAENNKKSKFFVVAIDYYGTKPYHFQSKHKFDPEDPSSMAYFLNNEFLKMGNTSNDRSLINFKLPQKIIDYIDYEHVWNCEEGGTSGDATEPYTVKCGVVIPSQEELIQYIDKVGWDDNYESLNNDYACLPWAVRATDSSGKIVCARPSVDKTKLLTYGATKNSIGIRPCFWLSEDFFRNVEMDLASVGKGVAEIMTRLYTKDEMTKLYTERQCYDYLGFTPDLSLSESNGVVSVINNRRRDVNGLMLAVLYDENHNILGYKSKPVFLSSDGKLSEDWGNRMNGKVKYAEVSVIANKMPYRYISNVVRLTSEK